MLYTVFNCLTIWFGLQVSRSNLYGIRPSLQQVRPSLREINQYTLYSSGLHGIMCGLQEMIFDLQGIGTRLQGVA